MYHPTYIKLDPEGGQKLCRYLYAPTPPLRLAVLWGLIETECLPPFQIQVKGITGRTTCVMIFGSDLVEEVARQIAQTIGMPATEIRLQWGGHALDMQNTVRSYGMQRDFVIFASLRWCAAAR